MTLDLLNSAKKRSIMEGKSNRWTTSPIFFRLQKKNEKVALLKLIEEDSRITISDTMTAQLEELVKIKHPSVQFGKEELKKAVKEHLGATSEEYYGVWVYYPWNKNLVHLLDEEEFVTLRTSRNLYKITPEERTLLANKKVGVIGLSVGQSVALTLAMERSFGELRIADFDTLELSNMNRLRTGVHHLGLPKTVITAREIAEIDPYLRVNCFHRGISEDNLENFISKNGNLDVLIDECDSLDIKIKCREKARQVQIPVLMDTSDRGMIDIERFDLAPNREILHGLIDTEEIDFTQVMENPARRINISTQIAGGEAISERLKYSLTEIGKSISTWPQLASSVALGGAVTTEICRNILCKENIPSGRFYVDTQKIITG